MLIELLWSFFFRGRHAAISAFTQGRGKRLDCEAQMLLSASNGEMNRRRPCIPLSNIGALPPLSVAWDEAIWGYKKYDISIQLNRCNAPGARKHRQQSAYSKSGNDQYMHRTTNPLYSMKGCALPLTWRTPLSLIMKPREETLTWTSISPKLNEKHITRYSWLFIHQPHFSCILLMMIEMQCL